MRRPEKWLTAVNFVLSSILWALGIGAYALNIARCWEWWQAVGFAFLYFVPVPAVAHILALAFSVKAKSKHLMLANAIALIVTVAFILLTVLVTARYG